MKRFVKIILPLTVVVILTAIIVKYSFFSEKRTLDFSGEKTVMIDDNGLNYKVTSGASTVAAVLAEKNLNLSAEDEVIPARDTAVLPGMSITVNRQAAVKISVDGKTLEKHTLTKTVSDVLLENEVVLSPVDTVEPGLQTRLKDGLEILVTRRNTEKVTVEEPIEFTVVKEKDGKVAWGEEVLGQTGEEGIREVTYEIDYENGKEVKRVKLSSKITKRPMNKVVKIGTKINVGKANTGIASWYNAGLDECASRDHPPGTWLRVTNSANGRQVFVKVAGYGPMEGTGKLIDLDNKSFKKLAPLGQGTMKVKVEEILNKKFNPEN